MQRIRMSLPYYKDFGWDAEIVTVNERHSEMVKDEILCETIPKDTIIHRVEAFPKKWTSKFGLGSMALRSLLFFRKKVSHLLQNNHYDLIYFSTTQFPITILGSYWKRKYRVPYIIDMQDPWHTDYYKNKQIHERPSKYWFSYRLNKYLEPLAMNNCDGIIAVSENYILDLQTRYKVLRSKPNAVITFGYSEIDFFLSKSLTSQNRSNKKILKYIGVLGPGMKKSLNLFFRVVKDDEKFKENFLVEFKGTSYARRDEAKKTAEPIAVFYNIDNILEDTNRLGLCQVLNELQQADGLLIFGTDDKAYTASKLYPYLQVRKPILAIFHPGSSAYNILLEISTATVISLFDSEIVIENKIRRYIEEIENNVSIKIDEKLFEEFSAKNMTLRQCTLFNKVVDG